VEEAKRKEAAIRSKKERKKRKALREYAVPAGSRLLIKTGDAVRTGLRPEAQPFRQRGVGLRARTNCITLAHRALGCSPLERFRVLNGLGPQDKVKPGDLVKMVVE
jgi:predicted Zn-dependent protease